MKTVFYIGVTHVIAVHIAEIKSLIKAEILTKIKIWKTKNKINKNSKFQKKLKFEKIFKFQRKFKKFTRIEISTINENFDKKMKF